MEYENDPFRLYDNDGALVTKYLTKAGFKNI